jgi:hypothetical protein
MANNNNQPYNNNYNNAASNNDDQLGMLLMQAQMVIDGFNQTGQGNYQDISDILHDLGVNPEFDERAVNGSEEMAIWTRLNEIRDQLAGQFHAQQRGAPLQVQVLAPAPGPIIPGPIIPYPIPNKGRRTLPRGAENLISRNNIRVNNAMVNFQGESGYGRYYKRNTFNALPRNAEGFKSNPATRARITQNNVVGYTANISGNLPNNLRNINTTLFVENGGKRRKTRRGRKAKKTRKGQRKY